MTMAFFPSTPPRKVHVHRIRCLIYLLTSLTCLQHHSIVAESAISIKLDAIQEVIKSPLSAQIDTQNNESNHQSNDELSDTDSAAINSIISQVSSWMDLKRQHDISKNQAKLFEDRTQTRHRPFVTLAYAQTLDGMIAAKIANDDRQSTSNLKLSCPQSLILTHKLRNLHDALIVGGSTFLIDAPQLNVRLPSNIMRESLIEQPIPVVLDTHLSSLQKLLYGKVIGTSEETMPQDMHPELIRATNPVLCCSTDAAKLFLDHLEQFQQQQKPVKKVDEFPGQLNRQQKRVYKITVYKMVDEENNHEEDLFLPIKITVQVTLGGNKIDESDVVTTTFTLLPCLLQKDNESLDLPNVLHQLNKQFEIDSVMVEGGAGVLSSFINECINSSDDKKSSSKKLVDCICSTISPSFIGMRGLPVFSKVNVENVSMTQKVLNDSKFVSLGRDCTFLGRI